MVPWVLMHINTTLFLLVRILAQMMAFPLREVCLFAKVAISDPVIANIVTMLLETFFSEKKWELPTFFSWEVSV